MKQRLPVLTSPRGTRALANAESPADSSTEAQRHCTASKRGPLRCLGGLGADCLGFAAAQSFVAVSCT